MSMSILSVTFCRVYFVDKMAIPVVLIMLACLIPGVVGSHGHKMCRSCTQPVRGPDECIQINTCSGECVTDVHHETNGEYVFRYYCGDSHECKDFNKHGHVHGLIVCRECCSIMGCDQTTCSQYFNRTLTTSTPTTTTTTTKTTTPITTQTTTPTNTPITTATTIPITTPTTMPITTATTLLIPTITQTTTPITTATTIPITTPTITPTTASPTTKTTKKTLATTKGTFVSKGCNNLDVITGLARGSSVSHPGTPVCSDGAHQPSEALIQEYCGAPSIRAWMPGVKVIENCPRIPSYTAIAALTTAFGGSTVAGVFIKCEVGGFQAAIQTCGSELRLHHVSTNSSGDIPSADKFVLLDWTN